MSFSINYNRIWLKRYERDQILCVAITQAYKIMVNTEELTGTTEYLTL